ncbi:hypothetical protein P691DRAFT_143362 [Macrolepiota fuliginosa MF-IS2]|uniref:Uncharacterized protein n=1 Tax=Macrolepiota fuliginosa MF-IS2 TaxID=1400762 RepID=A0A9P5XB71_9AGAR|nr:hypothetical protein P691DRAFT_143362 [Macrolepiota fuliginosa MF-IS2]
MSTLLPQISSHISKPRTSLPRDRLDLQSPSSTDLLTLTRVSLFRRYFTPDELRPICGLFSLRPLYSRLVHLRVDVTRTNSSVLFDIANRFRRKQLP